MSHHFVTAVTELSANTKPREAASPQTVVSNSHLLPAIPRVLCPQQGGLQPRTGPLRSLGDKKPHTGSGRGRPGCAHLSSEAAVLRAPLPDGAAISRKRGRRGLARCLASCPAGPRAVWAGTACCISKKEILLIYRQPRGGARPPCWGSTAPRRGRICRAEGRPVFTLPGTEASCSTAIGS